MNQKAFDEVRELGRTDPETAFQRFVVAFLALVRWWVSRKISNNHDIDDVTQNVFIKIFNKFQPMLSETKNIYGAKAWMKTITIRQVADWYRQRARRPDAGASSELSELSVESPDLAEKIEGTSVCADLIDALNELERVSPDQHQIVVLFYLEKRSHAEITNLLKVSEVASRVRLHRAMSWLKERLNVPNPADV